MNSMIMMMNCFRGMVDRRKAFSIISSRDHCQRFSLSQISDTPPAGFEPVQNLSSGLVKLSCAVVIATTPRRHNAIKVLPHNPHLNLDIVEENLSKSGFKQKNFNLTIFPHSPTPPSD